MAADMLGTVADAKGEILKDQPIGRIARADGVAVAVLWLCRTGENLLIGAALPVDGGFTAH